ncbi:hypothetical protein [Nocardia fluminea]|uniref:Methyltransferase family protein n=1 Tax=Nocardia fluminea TaxID=134984 RepID=A0A2N3VFX0_9NOCA|nr:hypothetical protein [Nocardia fluminea]PKV80507.1 hypothetical protein ATK86_4936 [Nocardia fluminea]
MPANSPQRRPRSTSSPTGVQIPSTLWTLRADRLDPYDRWPEQLVTRAVAEFSAPGSRVLLIDWPAPAARGNLRMFAPDTAAALARIRERDRDSTDDPRGGESADLVIASLLSDPLDPVRAAEYVTAVASEAMAMGALLVVLSRCRHSTHGVLLDPAGSVILAAQSADLLYLQHIIAAPVTGDTVTAAPPTDPTAPGLPRHVVAHVDVCVFLLPEHG